MAVDKMNLLIGDIRGEWLQIFESDSLRAYCIKSSRGTLVVEQDKIKQPEISVLMSLPADEQRKSVSAIIHYVESSRKTKPMKPFEVVAKAFKTEFKKKGRITFVGERWQSQGHLRMPKEAEEMKENPLFIDDLSAFLPFSSEGEDDWKRYNELKEKHPHTQNEESLFRKLNSPVMAFALFVKCFESGVYPPVDLLHWVAEGMKQFLAADGKDDLNTVFGFDKKGKGRNRRNAFDVLREMRSDALELMRMAALIDYFDLSIPEAAQFMARTGKYGLNEDEVNGSTYVRKWYTEWNKLLSDSDIHRSWYETFVLKRSGVVGDNNKLRFLDKFGPYGEKGDYLPENIKRFLKKHGRL